jgi:hypothetical protein
MQVGAAAAVTDLNLVQVKAVKAVAVVVQETILIHTDFIDNKQAPTLVTECRELVVVRAVLGITEDFHTGLEAAAAQA